MIMNEELKYKYDQLRLHSQRSLIKRARNRKIWKAVGVGVVMAVFFNLFCWMMVTLT